MYGTVDSNHPQPTLNSSSHNRSLEKANSDDEPSISPLLSFTYFPKSQSSIKAVKLTERKIDQQDVLTMYYLPFSIFFTRRPCQESLNYDEESIIGRENPEHTAELHKPENPTHYIDKYEGWHCHLKVSRLELTDFLGKIFKRHEVDVDNSHHKNQFMHSMRELIETPTLSGLIFKDGSITQNAECHNMEKSYRLKTDDFKQVGHNDQNTQIGHGKTS